MNITGSIKVIDVPDNEVLTDVATLIKSLEKYLAVEFDVDKITNVVVSSAQPTTTDKDVIWYKMDTSGNFVGVFIYVQSQWLQMFPVPKDIHLIYGNSTQVPPGYALVSNSLPGFTDAMVTKLKLSWLLSTSGSYYNLFHVVYIGL